MLSQDKELLPKNPYLNVFPVAAVRDLPSLCKIGTSIIRVDGKDDFILTHVRVGANSGWLLWAKPSRKIKYAETYRKIFGETKGQQIDHVYAICRAKACNYNYVLLRAVRSHSNLSAGTAEKFLAKASREQSVGGGNFDVVDSWTYAKLNGADHVGKTSENWPGMMRDLPDWGTFMDYHFGYIESLLKKMG